LSTPEISKILSLRAAGRQLYLETNSSLEIGDVLKKSFWRPRGDSAAWAPEEETQRREFVI
jgi:hypothetical protein